MIIGLNVRDNDYQDLLIAFGKKISSGDFVLEPPPAECPGTDAHEVSEWYSWAYDAHRACTAALRNPTPSEEDKRAVTDVLRRSWKYYVGKRRKNACEYLSSRLDVTFPDKIDDTWQNGEQLYVFPTSYADKLLLF